MDSNKFIIILFSSTIRYIFPVSSGLFKGASWRLKTLNIFFFSLLKYASTCKHTMVLSHNKWNQNGHSNKKM